MKQITHKKRAVIHGLSMAVFLGACLGLQADDKGVSAQAQVNTDRPGVEVRADRTDRDSNRSYRADNGKLSHGDASFIRDAAKGGLMEVQMGQAAKDHAANPEVKAYGERLVKDHTEANKKLTAMAEQKGLNLAKDMDRDDANKGAKMAMDYEGKQGADFDKAFIKHAISDHKKDIKKFEKASRDSEDSDLKSFASMTLPTLREHQMEAERLAKVLGVDVNVSDNSEIDAHASTTEAAGAPGLSIQNNNSSINRVDRDAKIESDVNVNRDRDNKAEGKVEVNTDKGDHKTLGVTTESGDNKTLGLQTQKGDNKILGVQTGPGDGKTLGLNTSKTDGKLLGIIPAPGHKKAENRVDVDMDRSNHRVDASVGGPASGEKGASVHAEAGDHKAGASVHADADHDKGAKVMAYADAPSKVQDTIKAEGGDANTKIRKQTVNGKTVYRVEIQKEGKNRVLRIGEDGTIMKDNKAK
jgi:putative membrane protein